MGDVNPGEWPRPPLLTRVFSRLVNPSGAVNSRRLHRAVAGKTVLITGASFGIGEVCAQLLASAGAKVLLAARSQEKLDAIALTIRAQGGSAEVYPVDLTDLDSVAQLGKRLLDAYGSIDIVVNNAGKSIRRSVALSCDRFHDFERTIGVNYLGPVRLLISLLPAMRQRRSGQVINVSTIGVPGPPSPRWGAYQASKSAFDVWFRSMGVETRADGVTTTTIYMPLVYTRMSAPTPTLRSLPGMYPAEAAGLIARAITYRRRVIAPWWLLPAQISALIFRRPLEWGMGRYFRRTTDSPSAVGSPGEGAIRDEKP